MYIRYMEDTCVAIHRFVIKARRGDLFARARELEITGIDPAAAAAAMSFIN